MSTDSPTYITEMPHDKISFDVEAFDAAIRSQGVLFEHWRAMRCPVGLSEKSDSRRPHDDHSGCSNGFLYTTAGLVTCLFVGNSMNSDIQELGVLDSSTVQATLPRFYDDGKEYVYAAPFDRLYLSNANIVVPNWHLQEAHVTGTDRLQFPAVKVQDLVDSAGIAYKQGLDFEITAQGQIRWLTQNRPGIDPETGKGRVYSIRYLYRPFFYIKSLGHELRVSQAEDPVTGVRGVQKMPQMVRLQREYVFLNEQKDEEAKNPESLRQVMSPSEGGFGPR